ncbi:MAG: phosphotransferase [Actinomycetota bacterium]
MTEHPRSSEEITVEWLNEVLDDDVRAGNTITGFEAEIIGEGVGFLGELARITLRYDTEAAGSTRSVITKMPTTNEGFRTIGLMLGFYDKEAGFYREIAPEITLRIPKCHLNRAADGEYLLVLEDLAPMRPGDQLASCTVDEAKLALTAAAQLHARWWEDPKLDAFADWLPAPGSPYFAMLEQAYLGALDGFHSDFADMVTPEIEALADRAAGSYERMVEVGGGRRPHTFVHGDFRLDNMLFGDEPDQEPFALIDFQIAFKANPLWDVAYFLGGSFDPERRREVEHELLTHYHARLVEYGVSDYTLEQCHEDYRAAALVLLGYLVTGAADIELDTLNDRGRAALELLWRRYSHTIMDLDSGSFL